MSFFRKSKKPRQPSQRPIPLAIPTQIALGALGISVDLDEDPGPGGTCFVQQNRATDLADLTIAPGECNRRGSKIVLPDSDEAHAHPLSGVSTPVRECEGGITCTCIFWLMGPMSVTLITVSELHGRKLSSDAPKEQPDRIAPDLSTAGGEPGVRGQEECKGQGTVAEQPPEVFPEHASEGDPGGECWRPR